MTIYDVFFFAVLPYAAVLQIIPGVYFQRTNGARLAELAPALASERSTWFSRAAWIGAFLMVLLHLVPLVTFGAWSDFVSEPVRLLTVEFIGLVGGVLFFVGIGAVLARRIRDQRLSPLRTALELAALWSLFIAAGAGVMTGVSARWASTWYARTVLPYLLSLLKASPDTEAISSLGFWPRVHFAFAFLSMALVPFTTLPRQLVAPLLGRLGRKPAAGGAR
jgi:nitrate reductase gamma subunit